MENYFLFMLGALFVSQFYAPFLASKIKSRFVAHGKTMELSTLWAMLNITRFWSEASRINREVKDKDVTKYLYIYYSWWALAIFTFIGYIAYVN